jgi:hypothetical protein
MTGGIDWASYIDQSKDAFAPAPVGTYNVSIEEALATKSSTDKLMFKIKFKIEDQGPAQGKIIFHNQTLSPESPKSMFMFFQQFEMMGIPKSVFASQPPPSPDAIAGMLHGKRCAIRIEHKLYQGVTREDIKEIKSAGAGGGGIAGVGAPPSIGVPAMTKTPPAPATPSAAPIPPPAVQTESSVPIPPPVHPVAPEADTAAPPPPPSSPF